MQDLLAVGAAGGGDRRGRLRVADGRTPEEIIDYDDAGLPH
jgi:hypothetical protein